MLPETHPLIETITQPLADNAEMQLSAIQILEQSFDPDHPSVPHAMERLEARDKKKFPALGKIAIWILALAVLGFAIYTDIDAIRTSFSFDHLIYCSCESAPAPRLTGLTPKERLLFGDPELDELSQKFQLFDSDQSNPAYFAEYAQAHHSSLRTLPSNFLETAKRIDPENAFFLYWYAGNVGDECVEKKEIPRPTKKSKTPPSKPNPPPRYVDGVELKPLPVEQEYTIKDQAAYDEALNMIKQASELPHFESYETKMLKARMRLMPASDSASGYLRRLILESSVSSMGISLLIKVSIVMNARAEELSKNGQREEFLLLAAQRDTFVLKLAHTENFSLVQELILAVVASRTAVNFQAAAERLELLELAETYRKQNDGFVAESDRRSLDNNYQTEELLEKHGAMFSRLMLPMIDKQAKSPPPLLDADLKPLRMAEHEIIGRFGILSAALILLPTTLVLYFFRFLTPKAIRLTAKRIACLLKPADWIWIFVLGIALPILVFLYINRLSPVSGRDYGISYFQFVFPGLHLSALLATLLLAPAIVTRWRLTRRAAAFKFGSRLDLLSLPVIGVMLVYAIVAYPVLVKVHNLNTMVQIGLAAPLVGWLGFVFFNGLRIFLGSARSRIIQTATAIAVIPAYPLAIIALCLVLTPYREGEKYWLSQEKLHLIDPDAPDLGAYECKVAAQKRKEINAIMGIE